jgi:hypothetical protein
MSLAVATSGVPLSLLELSITDSAVQPAAVFKRMRQQQLVLSSPNETIVSAKC